MPAQRSIVIGGGAFAGLGLALGLRQGLGPDIPIIVADPALGLRPSRDPRATAIVAACRRLFEALGVWDQVAAQTQPILDMVVTDSRLQDATRPVFLTFAGDVEPGEAFAPKSIFCPQGHSRSCRSRENAHRWYGPRSVTRPRASSRSARMNFIASSNSALGCISARSRRRTDRARSRLGILSRARSSANGWRWSATPRM